MNKEEMLIIVRGGGDIATGTIYKLWRSGFKILVLETDHPSAIRRQVSVCEAVYYGEARIEDLTAVKIEPEAWLDYQTEVTYTVINRENNSCEDQVNMMKNAAREELWLDIRDCYEKNVVPVLVDKSGVSIDLLKPQVVVDAILAKKNLGTKKDFASLTIALGPGFEAGVDVDYVIETMRGHNLGRIIEKGYALPNTGVPGVIAGYDKQRVIYASGTGEIELVHQIGDFVNQGEVIAWIVSRDGTKIPVHASITGLIRGLISEKYAVTVGFKIADIDPRQKEYDNCFTISDKARCIAGSVLELICREL